MFQAAIRIYEIASSLLMGFLLSRVHGLERASVRNRYDYPLLRDDEIQDRKEVAGTWTGRKVVAMRMKDRNQLVGADPTANAELSGS